MASLKHVVVTVHGIRTFGQWQQRLASMLISVDPEIEIHSYSYGYFSVIAFLVPPLRWLVTKRFRTCLENILGSREDIGRLDLVGHSFGTHLIGWALRQRGSKQLPPVHTVILAGSVLRQSFDWAPLFQSGQVDRVINECGINDSILVLNQVAVLFTGMAGRLGFQGMTGRRLFNRYYKGGHSLYFEQNGAPVDSFMRERWLSILLTANNVEPFDERATPSALEGIKTTLLQNFEVIKIGLWYTLLVTPALVFATLAQQAEDERDRALQTLQWVFNEVTTMEFDRSEAPYLATGVLERLHAANYAGQIHFRGHVGTFLFTLDERVSPDESPVLVTNALLRQYPDLKFRSLSNEYALRLSDRLAQSFETIISQVGFQPHQVLYSSYGMEKPSFAYPTEQSDIDEWNRIARLNNRVEIELDVEE